MDEKSIFLTALEKSSPDKRTDYLDSACGEDSEMRRRVETLLQTYDDAGSFLEHPPEGVDLGRTEVGDGDTAEPQTASEDGTLLNNFPDEVNLDFLTPSDADDALGLIGHYEVQSVIGRGGMGIVLRAHDPKLGRIVAVKVLAPEYAANPTARTRFSREAKAAAAVSHPHVIMTHQVEVESQPPFLVMEYVDGQSLREKIEKCGALETREILRIGVQVAAGLAAAHKQGLMHRDIKPANILLENGIESVKITDFGLARTVDDIGVTRTGEVAGTPQFMSPEQARGDAIDQRSDLFSLGSVLYTMCTGRAPFRAETTYGVIRCVIEESPRSIREINPDIPEWLCDVIEKLLAKTPDGRFQTAGEVAELLEQYLAHLQHPASAPEPAPIRKTTSSQTDSPRPIPRAVKDHRPDASAQSRKLALLALAAAMFVFLPCLLLMITEATGLTHVASLFSTGNRMGTLIVDVNDPTISVTISGEGQSIATAGYQSRSLREGQYYVVVTSTANGQFQTHNQFVLIERGTVTTVSVPWISAVPDAEPIATVDAPSLADIPHQQFTGWGASWSPDGTAIVLQSSPDVGADPDGMLQILQLESGQTRPLVRHGKDPAWSPRADGPIAYVLHGDQREDIWLIDADGQNNHQFVEGGFPSWSADGSTLYYQHNPSGTLRAVEIDDPVLTPRTLIECNYLYPVVSPDGTMFARRQGSDLVVVDIETGVRILKHDMSETRGLLASWTGDSRQIVFGGYGFQSDGPLTLVDVNSGQARHLLQQPLTMPRFSPDGTRLVVDDRIAHTVVVLDVAEILNTPADVEPDTDHSLSEDRLKILISQAASIPNNQWISLAGDVKGPGADAVSGTPLSMVLLTLDPLTVAQNEPRVQQDFWYLTEQIPRPSEIADAMWISRDAGYASAIQPEYVTNVQLITRDDVAHGHVGFSAPKLYVGRVEFIAHLADDVWTIRELTLPNYGITLALQHDGVWENINAGGSETDQESTEPVSESEFYAWMSDLSRFINCCGFSTTITITKGEPSSESGASAGGLNHETQLVSDVLGPPERMNEFMGALERELRFFGRQFGARLDAIATAKDTEDRIVRLTADYSTEPNAHGEVEFQLENAEAPADAEPGIQGYTLTLRIEEWVRIPEIGPDGLIRSVTTGEETGIPPPPPQTVRD